MTPPRKEANRSAPDVSDTVVVREPGAGEGNGEIMSAQRPYLVHTAPGPQEPQPVPCPQPSSPQLRLWHAGWQHAPSMHSCNISEVCAEGPAGNQIRTHVPIKAHAVVPNGAAVAPAPVGSTVMAPTLRLAWTCNRGAHFCNVCTGQHLSDEVNSWNCLVEITSDLRGKCPLKWSVRLRNGWGVIRCGRQR